MAFLWMPMEGKSGRWARTKHDHLLSMPFCLMTAPLTCEYYVFQLAKDKQWHVNPPQTDKRHRCCRMSHRWDLQITRSSFPGSCMRPSVPAQIYRSLPWSSKERPRPRCWWHQNIHRSTWTCLTFRATWDITSPVRSESKAREPEWNSRSLWAAVLTRCLQISIANAVAVPRDPF